jgi:hypothetical protein
MGIERVRVSVSDGGLDEPRVLDGDVRLVYFELPNGERLEVEAFVRHGDGLIYVRCNRGAPVIVPRAGNVIAVGVVRD